MMLYGVGVLHICSEDHQQYRIYVFLCAAEIISCSCKMLWLSDAYFSSMSYMKYDVGVQRWLIGWLL